MKELMEIEFSKENGVSQRVINVMESNKTFTIGEFIMKGGIAYISNMKYRNCGASTLKEIQEFVDFNIKNIINENKIQFRSYTEILYDTYKGRNVKCNGDTGVICGYNDEYLIYAITSGRCGWDESGGGDKKIFTNKNNEYGYRYCRYFNKHILRK